MILRSKCFRTRYFAVSCLHAAQIGARGDHKGTAQTAKRGRHEGQMRTTTFGTGTDTLHIPLITSHTQPFPPPPLSLSLSLSLSLFLASHAPCNVDSVPCECELQQPRFSQLRPQRHRLLALAGVDIRCLQPLELAALNARAVRPSQSERETERERQTDRQRQTDRTRGRPGLQESEMLEKSVRVRICRCTGRVRAPKFTRVRNENKRKVVGAHFSHERIASRMATSRPTSWRP